MGKYEPPYTILNKMLELVSSISEKIGKISRGLLVLIVAFSLTGCGSSKDALEISDTESAQAEGISQETATATPAISQTIPETTTEPEPEKLTYQTGLYQEKTLADQVSVDAARELPEGEYGVLSYSYDETVSVWGNGAEIGRAHV